MKSSIAILITILAWATGAFMVSRTQLHAAATMPPDAEQRHLAVTGDPNKLDATVKSFLDRQQLRLLRDYPAPDAYLQEGGLPAAAALRLYEVTMPPVAASGVVSAVIGQAQANEVRVNTEHLEWLTYLPDELLVSGDCEEITRVQEILDDNPDLNLQQISNVTLNYPGLTPGEAGPACIVAFTFAANFRVAAIVAQFNAHSETLLAEPNYIATGAQYIAGSPGGPQEPAQGLLPLRSPLTTTGKGVSIYVFDSTAPYTLTAPITRTEMVSDTAVMLHAFTPLPTNLPNGPAAPGHGVFVLSPMLQLAPNAKLHLVRTLNRDNYGDAGTLIRSLDRALHSLPSNRQIIFNYSFGLAGPNQPTLDNALVRLLEVIDQLGITQVGAAGNDSAYTNQPRRDVLPARHPRVISVGAVTKQGERACYSNVGEISALGGGIAHVNGRACHTAQIVATCNATNERCVSAWVPRPQGPPYSWGVGTSFATPIITALAAQSAEELAASGVDVTPHRIRQRLQALASKGCNLATGIGCLP